MTLRSPHDDEETQVFVVGLKLWLTSRSKGLHELSVSYDVGLELAATIEKLSRHNRT